MEAQTQDASQNRFSWKRPSGRGGLEHRLLREVASVCRLPRGKRLHLTCLGDPSVALRYPPRSHPRRLERSPAHLCPRLSFQGNRGGSWGHTTGDTDLSLPRCSPHSTRYVEQTTVLWAQRFLYQNGGNNNVSLQKLTGVGGYPTQLLCSISGSRAV